MNHNDSAQAEYALKKLHYAYCTRRMRLVKLTLRLAFGCNALFLALLFVDSFSAAGRFGITLALVQAVCCTIFLALSAVALGKSIAATLFLILFDTFSAVSFWLSGQYFVSVAAALSAVLYVASVLRIREHKKLSTEEGYPYFVPRPAPDDGYISDFSLPEERHQLMEEIALTDDELPPVAPKRIDYSSMETAPIVSPNETNTQNPPKTSGLSEYAWDFVMPPPEAETLDEKNSSED